MTGQAKEFDDSDELNEWISRVYTDKDTEDPTFFGMYEVDVEW